MLRSAIAAVLVSATMAACEPARVTPPPHVGPPSGAPDSPRDAGAGPPVGDGASAAAEPPSPSLGEAAQAGDLAALKRLITNGADLEQLQSPYGTALMAALEFEREDAARALLEAGAKVGPTSAALALAARGNLVRLFPLLMARGADVKRTDNQGHTALHAAARYASVDAVRELLRLGADVDAVGDDGFTPLHSATAYDRIDTVRALLDAHARIGATSRGGTTVLHWAVFANRSHREEYFSDREDTPPHQGPEKLRNDAPLVELLLARGASVDAADGEGNTPLHQAAFMNAPAAARALLARGAKKSARNKARQTPLDLAKARGERALIELLR